MSRILANGSLKGILPGKLTHGSVLSQNPQNQYGFEDEEHDKTDQREQLVQDVESDVAVSLLIRHEMAGPVECGIQGDIASTDEEHNGGRGN